MSKHLTSPLKSSSFAAVLPTETSVIPRGISPSTLIDQIRNTAPFLWSAAPAVPYVDFIREVEGREDLTHFEYFRLCVSAHWATVATFVPTDVDNQIRHKLWHPGLPIETLRAMAELALAARDWDARPLTTRFVEDAGFVLSGHSGEWFSIAVAAYAALRRRDPDLAARLAGAIVAEAQGEAALFARLRARGDGLNALRASTLIAHNLGDLDRVIEMWNLPADDPLREAAFKLGHPTEKGQPARTGWRGDLVAAGELNQAHMAAENHRHFALRKPKCLRRSIDLLLPTGPFFDDWGKRMAAHPALSREDVAEVVLALIEGWERLPETVGYPRALAGVREGFRGGLTELARYLPAKRARQLQAGPLHTLMSVSRARFEQNWQSFGLRKA